MNVDKILFFKGTELLIAIKNAKPNQSYAIKLSRTVHVGYARVNQLLKLFKKFKLIEFIDLDGRTKGVKLTKKGEKIVNNLISIKEALR